jgi:signal transduction histidine kinase
MVIIIGVLFEKQKNFENTLKERIEEEIKKNQEQQILMFQQNKRAQMGDMINMIAHQWRQPLNNISLLSELITRGFQNNTLNEKTINYFKESSKKQIEYMSKTIDEFLNFFKEEKDKETADVNLILKSAVSMVEPTYKQKNIKINFETPKEGAFINTYPNKLLQVILNILNNAKDALHKKEQKEIFIKIKDTSDKIEISIEDTAGGIDKEIIEHIFDPYFSTKKDSGTGLGLYMTKVILKEQLNGDITVQNTEKGAKFTVTLNK